MNNPHLAYALLQAQVLLGIISPHDAQQLHLAAQQQPQIPVNPIPVNPIPVNSMSVGPLGPGFVPSPYPQPFPQQPNLQFQQPMPMIQQPIPLQQPSVDALDGLDDDKKELLEQVMNLTPEQIEKLQPHEQQQIMQLRQAMSTFNFRGGR